MSPWTTGQPPWQAPIPSSSNVAAPITTWVIPQALSSVVTPTLISHSVHAPAPQHTPASAALLHSVPQLAESDDSLFELNDFLDFQNELIPIDDVSLEQFKMFQESNDIINL